MQEIIEVSTSKREGLIDITSKVQSIVKKSNIKEGLCNVYVNHTSAAIIINENADPSLCDDIIESLGKLIPKGVWKHDNLDGNADSHIKATILGPSESIPIKDNGLVMGTWQGIMLFELDGPRKRKISVTILGK